MDKDTVLELAKTRGITKMSLAGNATIIHGLPYLVVERNGEQPQVWKLESYIDAKREQATAWYSNLIDYIPGYESTYCLPPRTQI